MRVSSPALDAILDIPIPVLDKGWVMPVDYMGNDDRILESARISYQNGTVATTEISKRLFAMKRDHHNNPFESCVLHVKMYVPLAIWAQLKRYRVASINEESLRYSEAVPAFHVPAIFRRQSKTNKQASVAAEDINQAAASAVLVDSTERSYAAYKALIDSGVSREQARFCLPVNLFVKVMWKLDLRNMFHIFMERLDTATAQWETAAYVEVLRDIVKKWVPIAYAAFEEHELYASRFSRTVTATLVELLKSKFTLEEVISNLDSKGIPKSDYRNLVNLLT